MKTTSANHSPAHALAWRRWALLLAIGASHSGCSSESKNEPVTSSQTHWLLRCDSDSDCGERLSCECGVCTEDCQTSASCSDLGQAAVCAATQGVDTCGGNAPSNICVQGCGEDDVCGKGTTCVAGACVPAADTDASVTPQPSGQPAPGVPCANYASCDATVICAAGAECIAFAECGGAVCISSDEACALSCPEGSDCLIQESYPAQIACDDKAPAIPAPALPAPEGLDCSEYYACGAEAPCDEGSCLAFDECGGGICVDLPDACTASCPDPDACSLAKSNPPQIVCDGRVAPRTGTPLDPGGPFTPDDQQTLDPSEPFDAGAGPSGVDCNVRMACGVGDTQACSAEETCIAIQGCDGPVCINADTACAQSCPDPTTCMLLESFPLQISCAGLVPGSGEGQHLEDRSSDAGDPATDTVQCGDDVCTNGARCCDHCTGLCDSANDTQCPDYINPEHSCSDGAAVGPVCGDVTCALDERCCDHCSGRCAPLGAELVCPDDDGAAVCDEQAP